MQQPNLLYLDELADGDEDFRNEFIGVLKTEFPEERQTYQNHIITKDYIEASLIVHKLKHKLNVLGLTDAYKVAIDYEEQLKIDDLSLETHFFSILDSIETYLKTI